MKPLILTILCSAALAADTMKLPDVEPPKIKLPDGWEKNPEPVTSGVIDFSRTSAWTDFVWIDSADFTSPSVTIKQDHSGTVTFTGRGGSNWLIVHPGERSDWSPEAVLVETKNEPVVTKIGDRWVIRFKP